MTSLINPNNIFALEQQVLADLNDFQKKAAIYSRCEGNSNTANKALYNIQDNKVCSTSDNNIVFAVVKNSYDKLMNPVGSSPVGSLTLLKNAVDAYKLANPNSNTQSAVYDASYNRIMTQVSNMNQLRQSLEAKLAELYEIGDTRSNFYQRKLMSDSYTKIILTILATTLTIAAFASMRR